MRGVFISIEGIEGTGKSTQARLLYEWLGTRGVEAIITEEPGGTSIGLKIRELLLAVEHKEITATTELLLYNASRAQHMDQVIRPALERGSIVITDRFSDSTIAYQGYGRGIDTAVIEALDRISTGGSRPDLTLLLDLNPGTGLKRNKGIKEDRIELEDLEFHTRVRAGFLRLAEENKDRIKVIDASAGVREVSELVVRIVSAFLEIR